MTTASWSFMRAHWTHWLALGFGAGLSPRAPGTVGTLVGFPVFWLMGFVPVEVRWWLWAGLFVLGIGVCDRTAKKLGQEDPGPIVWDEVMAFVLVLMSISPTVGSALAGFVLFRLFDVLKPFPVSWADRQVKGGLGIMLDDLLAACYALACLWLWKGVWHVFQQGTV